MRRRQHQDGDGCSSLASSRWGTPCDAGRLPPAQLNLPSPYRDFLSTARWTPTRPTRTTRATARRHHAVAQATLDANGKPVIDGRCSAGNVVAAQCPYGQEFSTQANFAQWYRDTPNVNVTVRSALLLPRQANGSYLFDSAAAGGFSPARQAKGWRATSPSEGRRTPAQGGSTTSASPPRSVISSSTTAARRSCSAATTTSGCSSIASSGSISGRCTRAGRGYAHDGRRWPPRSVSALDGIYEVALFHAERHTDASNFKLTLTGFMPIFGSSTCASTVRRRRGRGNRAMRSRARHEHRRLRGLHGRLQARPVLRRRQSRSPITKSATTGSTSPSTA